jgi:sugar phosphate isomerase/epimerase
MIAVSSPAFSVLEFSQALETIARDFQAWEVVAEGRHDLKEIEKQFLELTPSYDLEYSAHAPMSDINIGSLNPRMREAALRELLTGLGACRRLGMDVYTVHPAFLTPLGFVSPDQVKEVTKSALRKLDAFSQELGVKVALENMPRSPFSMATTPETLLELLDGTELGICLDVGHAHTMGRLKDFVKLKKGIVNLHVHDNQGVTDEHLPIGDGTVDFPWLLRSLSGYKGRYVIESRGLEDALVSRDRPTALMAKT